MDSAGSDTCHELTDAESEREFGSRSEVQARRGDIVEMCLEGPIYLYACTCQKTTICDLLCAAV